MSPAGRILLHAAVLVLFPPILPGIIARVKAWVAGRSGPPVLQPYWDLWKLLRKGAVYGRSTTWVFRAGPIVSLAGALAAGLLLPVAGDFAPLAFPGDVVLFAYLLALGRFFTMAAALDTGSSFEGMGASREAEFSALSEPALFLVLGVICLTSDRLSLSGALSSGAAPGVLEPAVAAAMVALFGVFLAENSRIPVDDPNTHLELTMIHEVMVLDHGGPDLGIVLYGSAVKMFVLAGLLVRMCLPSPGGPWESVLFLGCGAAAVAGLTGVVESVTVRLRLRRVPQFLVGASVLAAIGAAAVFLQARG